MIRIDLEEVSEVTARSIGTFAKLLGMEHIATTSPFGGVKQGGWGRELSSGGLEAFLETNNVSLSDIS